MICIMRKYVIGVFDLVRLKDRGARWLGDRVLDMRLRGCGFEPHWRHCVVSLSNTLYPLPSTRSTQEDLSRHEGKIVDW